MNSGFGSAAAQPSTLPAQAIACVASAGVSSTRRRPVKSALIAGGVS
jgi:hypothetical protein